MLDDAGGAAAAAIVFGGKITTFRKLAEHALDKLAPYLPAMPEAPGRRARRCPGGDMPERRFRRFPARLPSRHPWLPRCPRATLRPALRHARQGRHRRRQVDRRSRPTHSGALLYEREARFLRDTGMGPDRGGHADPPDQACAPHERRGEARLCRLDGGGLTGDAQGSGRTRHAAALSLTHPSRVAEPCASSHPSMSPALSGRAKK